MILLSMPTTPETIYPTLKHDEKILCTDAIVVIDSKGEITWFDKKKLLNIVVNEEEPKS